MREVLQRLDGGCWHGCGEDRGQEAREDGEQSWEGREQQKRDGEREEEILSVGPEVVVPLKRVIVSVLMFRVGGEGK